MCEEGGVSASVFCKATKIWRSERGMGTSVLLLVQPTSLLPFFLQKKWSRSEQKKESYEFSNPLQLLFFKA